MAQLEAESEAMARAHELEQDTQWEIDKGLHDTEIQLEQVPVELLPEVQREW